MSLLGAILKDKVALAAAVAAMTLHIALVLVVQFDQ
jgi:hypothetical protein